jgi:hypothetical protein
MLSIRLNQNTIHNGPEKQPSLKELISAAYERDPTPVKIKKVPPAVKWDT